MRLFSRNNIVSLLCLTVGGAAGYGAAVQLQSRDMQQRLIQASETISLAAEREQVQLRERLERVESERNSLAEQVQTQRATIVSMRSTVTELGAPSSINQLGIAEADRQTAGLASQNAADSVDAESEADLEKQRLESEQAALSLIFEFVEQSAGLDDRERRRQMRRLRNELRELGEPAIDALVGVVQGDGGAGERLTAVRLLASMRTATASPVFEQVLSDESDVLIRRSAARGLARIAGDESIPVLESLIASADEDPFVRISSAYGLANIGDTRGVDALHELYTNAGENERVSYWSFRALAALDRPESIPLMEQVAASSSDASYRVRAIEFLGAHAARSAVLTLQSIVQQADAPDSVREAANRALADLN